MIDFTTMRDGCYAFIISAQRQDAGYLANEDARRELHRTLAERVGLDVIGFLPCQGCYKGEPEPSFLVFASGHELAHKLRERFHQESVLVIDRYGLGHLHFAAGPASIGEADWAASSTSIGEADWADRETAKREHDAYTLIEGFIDALVFE